MKSSILAAAAALPLVLSTNAYDCSSEPYSGNYPFAEAHLTLYDSTLGGAYMTTACVGDFDGDGDTETAAQKGNVPDSPSEVYIADAMSGEIDLSLNAVALGAYNAVEIACPGDVNGDGMDDLLVANDGIYLYFGAPEFAMKPSVTLGDQGEFDYNLIPLGDVNGDGFADIQMSDAVATWGFEESGAIYVFYGSTTPQAELHTEDADVTYYGEYEGDRLGSRLMTSGDVNGDGHDDMLIVNNRSTYVDTNSTPGMRLRPSKAAEITITLDETFYGVDSARIGDFNGNDLADIAVGAYWYDEEDNWQWYGTTHLFLDVSPGTYTVERADARTIARSVTPFAVLADGSRVLLSETTAEDDVIEVDVDGAEVHSGDINGDGFDDLLTRTRPQVTLNYGTSTWPALITEPDATFGNGDEAGAADFLSVSHNGDITICTGSTGEKACYGF